ncbi:MAG: FG-GAP-like repeat-containing protein [Pseudomonadota bacterium]
MKPESSTNLVSGLQARLAVMLASLSLTFLVMSPTFAASPSDNSTLRPFLISQVAVHDAAVIGGLLAPGLAGTAFEASAISSDFSLKFTAPTFELSDMNPDLTAPVLERVPNTSIIGGPTAAQCTYRFSHPNRPLIDDRNTKGISAEYAATFGIIYDSTDRVFSEFGTPKVYHPHAEVTVSVNNPFLGVPNQPGLTAFEIRDLQQFPRFPEGRHELRWSAQAHYHPIIDGALPAGLLLLTTASENYIKKKILARGGTQASANRVAKNTKRLVTLAEQLGLLSLNFGDANKWYKDTLIDAGRNSIDQELIVWDTNTPFILDSGDLPINTFSRNDAIEVQDIEIEATDFGGVRFRRAKDDLQSRFAAVDLCGKDLSVTTFTPDSELLTIGTQPNIVQWNASEIVGGPYKGDTPLSSNQQFVGDNILTTLQQRITVVDTQAPILLPPSGFSRYDEDGIDVAAEEYPFGRPRVVDLADASPNVSYVIESDDPSFDQTFLPGPPPGVDGVRYRVRWDAEDASGNVSSSGSAPGELEQLITLKRPGTNTPPTAGSGITAATITSDPVEITLTGVDSDLIDGIVDPLRFEIDQLPADGQFEAPLYPYFIEDFRLTPVGEREEGDNTTRVSPLGFLAEGFANTLPEDHGTYLATEICNASPGSQSFTEFGGVIPIDMVYEPTFVHVDDDGFYYFRDKYYVCGEILITTHQDQRADLSPIPRISRWSEDGELVAWAPLYATSDPNDLETPIAEFIWPLGFMEIDNGGRLWVPLRATTTTPGAYSITWYSYDNELTEFQFHNSRGFPFSPVPTGESQYALTVDANTGLLFEVIKDEVLIWDQTGVLDWTDASQQVGTLDVSSIAFDSEPASQIGSDMVIDQDGNVFVLDQRRNRVHKWLPTVADGQGGWGFGEYVGWLGSCTGNNLIPGTTTPYNACDTDTGTSRGFACSDEKCMRAPTPAATAGTAVGQFDAPESIEVDPNGVIYIADTQNSRVQRFGSDGTFAGQAISTGSGINLGDEPGFMLGNFGQPKQLSVNSTAFFVMEPNPQNGDNFVNVFKTSPFWDVTDSSAVVRYVSDFNFQGSDSFTYVVDDGIDESAPASVGVTVTRAFRPPEQLRAACFVPGDLVNEVPCSVLEDGALDIRLISQDPDGFLADAPDGLDTHTFNILDTTDIGTLTIEDPSLQQDNSIVYRYTPDPDVHGSDQFTFDVFDGAVLSEEQETVEIEIVSVPDVAVIDLDTTFTAARGFRRAFTADFSDVDKDPLYEPELTLLGWGDGAQSLGNAWQNSGNYDANGREVTPQIDFLVNEGKIFGTHRYDSVGNFTLLMEMSNPSLSAELPQTIATASVNVIEATVLGSKRLLPSGPVDPEVPFPLNIEITNYLPDGWAGLAAGDVQVIIELPENITVTPVNSRCVLTTTINCDLDDLTPGESTVIELTASVPLDVAREELDFVFTLEIIDDGPKVEARTFSVESFSIADQDGDGVIDVDDAFDNDPDYSADTDGDGIPDGWELEYGFDPQNADDASSDIDGDGFTLLEEYLNRSFPYLAEIEAAAIGENLELPGTSDNRFGWSVAGGDINQDGYADVLIGAPNESSSGNAYILFGGESGSVGGMQRIEPRIFPQDPISAYGRTVAVGDWDDNGYPDIAVGHSNGFYLHYNNGTILDWEDRTYGGIQPTSNHGFALLNADLDGDGLDDLIATASSAANGGLVYLYMSTRGGTDGVPLIIIEPTTVLGESVAVGDIDGDGNQDLLVGSPGGSASDVFVYLGRDNNWATIPANPVRSFTLLTPGGNSQFGYRVVSGADVGGDGIDDVVVSAYGGAGAVHLYDSADNWIPPFGQSVAVSPSQTIPGLDDGSGPGDSFPDQMGVGLALGHLDTDGFADLVVGGNRAGNGDEGEVRLFRGSAGGFQLPDERFEGAVTFDMLGYSVAIPGDIDNDGFNDVIGGAPDVVANGRPSADGGHVQILYHRFMAANVTDDTDGDGVANPFDNCANNANTNQSNLDGDGTGDVCDVDIDGDGFDNSIDNCPEIASLNQEDLDGDGEGDLCDVDDDGDGVDDGVDAFPLNFDYIADSDSDGLPDAFETANGLDPQNGSDGAGDLDGDGRSNLDEFLQDTDIANDDVPPTLAVPQDLNVDSTGYLTPVDLGTAIANDVLDGSLNAVVDDPGPYRPGRHILTWSVSDAAGNSATDIQVLDVLPLINFSRPLIKVVEGESVQVDLKLNGEAPTYPITLELDVAGSAIEGQDFSITERTVTISDRRIGTSRLSIAADSIVENVEDVVLSITDTSGAATGGNGALVLRIIDGNVVPRINIGVAQNHAVRLDVVPGEGQVTVNAEVIDPNPEDTHAFDWTHSDNALVPIEGYFSPTFTFNPAGLIAGIYRVEVTVTDSGDPSDPITMSRWIRVLPEAPLLSYQSDFDHDGVDDRTEGYGDADLDGTPDWQDPTNAVDDLVFRAGQRNLLQTDKGLFLTLGAVATATGTDASVTIDDVQRLGDAGIPPQAGGDQGFQYLTDAVDFGLSDLPEVGGSARVVVPLGDTAPADAGYRLYHDTNGWQSFVDDTHDRVESAPGTAESCPAPGSDQYRPGIQEGHRCVQLTMRDGGPNDADGSANRVLKHTGGVAMKAVVAMVSIGELQLPDARVVPGQRQVPMLRFRLNSNTGSTWLDTITLRATGSGDDSQQVSNVTLWADIDGNGVVSPPDIELGVGRYDLNDGQLELSATTPFSVPSGDSDYLVTYDF